MFWYVWRKDELAFLESLGTVCIGATLGFLMLAPLTAPTQLLGFMTARPAPAAYDLGFVQFSGMFALWVIFAVSSIPGSIIGYIVLKALRQAGIAGRLES